MATLVLGSSILKSIRMNLKSQNPLYVIAIKGGTLDIKQYWSEFKTLNIAAEKIDKIILAMIGGNDLFSGKLYKKTHYHIRNVGKNTNDLKSVCSRYLEFFEALKKKFVKAKFHIIPPLARRCFPDSVKCKDCLIFNSFTAIRILSKHLKRSLSKEKNCKIEESQKMHKFFFIRAWNNHKINKTRLVWKNTNIGGKGSGRHARNWLEEIELESLYRVILSTDHIHLSERGKKLLSKYINNYVLP